MRAWSPTTPPGRIAAKFRATKRVAMADCRLTQRFDDDLGLAADECWAYGETL